MNPLNRCGGKTATTALRQVIRAGVCAAATVALAAPSLLAQGTASRGWPREKPATFVDLAYPPDALDARIVGRVVVRATTDDDGRVISAESIAGPERLVPAAIANVRLWTLSPGRRTAVVVYRFEIDPALCNDDRRSLFRLVAPNLAVITACTGPSRAPIPRTMGELDLVSWGGPATYPQLGRSFNVSGVVVLELDVDRNGSVVNTRALTDIPILTEAAIAASKQWRFRPGQSRSGVVVHEFALDKRRCDPEDEAEIAEITSGFVRLSACPPFVEV